MSLGEYLLQVRTDRGFTIRDLAEKSGISTAEISRLESGKRLRPSPGVLKALADALVVDYSVLMQLAGYIEELQESGNLTRRVFRDEDTGEIVDILDGVQKMVETDEDWANVAYRVSRNLNDNDREVIKNIVKTYLESKRREQDAGRGGK